MTTEEQLDYLAGFFDAEGCVYFSNNGKQRQVMYSVGQSDPAVLYLFRGMFGGSVRKRAEATDKHREQWLWLKTCTRLDVFASMMIGRTAIKSRQLELAIMFSKTLRPMGGGRTPVADGVIKEREAIRQLLKEAKGKQFDDEDVAISDMSLPYWAGLFDGDGSAGVNKNKRCFYSKVAIASSYVPVLEGAKRQFSGYVVAAYPPRRARDWKASTQSAEAFLRKIEPYVIVKASVVRSVLALREFAANSRKLMVCDSRGQNRRFPDSVIQEMESRVAHIRELNRFGPNRKVA